MVLRIVEHKFGPLSDSSSTMIDKLNSQQLQAVVDVALDASTMIQVHDAVEHLLANPSQPVSDH